MLNKFNTKSWQLFYKKNAISSIPEKMDFSYEEAILPREKQLDELINKESIKLDELSSKSQEEELQRNGIRPSDYEIDLYNEQGDIYHSISIHEDQKHAIKEMQLVHLYKNVEILLKEIIVTAFPEENKKELFKWDNVKNFFRLKGIEFTSISSYEFINQLRIVNNNIKHSSEIDREIKKQGISEFKELDEFDYDSLCKFYTKIKPYTVPFLKDVAKNISDYLFVYSDDRINEIAKTLSENMDKNTVTLLSEALTKEAHNRVAEGI